MKSNASLIVGAILTLPGFLSAQNLEYWSFDGDSAGLGLQGITNSGALGSTWNFDTSAQGDVTNGSGQFVIAGDSGTFTRKLPAAGTANANPSSDFYASPITTGAYRFEIDLAAWDVSTLTNGDNWSFGINSSAGTRVARFALRVNGSDFEVQYSGSQVAGGNANFRTQTLGGLTGSTASILAIEFDFDNDTSAYYFNDTELFSFNDFSGDEIAQMIYSKGGSWSDSGSSITLDSFGYSAIPEPRAYAILIALFGFTACLVIRRRRA